MTRMAWVAVTALALAALPAIAQGEVVAWDAVGGSAGLSVLPVGGDARVESTWVPLTGANGAVRLSFAKGDSDRRFVGYAVELPKGAPGAQSLIVRHRLHVAAGQAPRMGILLLDDQGGSWARVSREDLSLDAEGDVAVPLTSLSASAFSASGQAGADLGSARRLWVGLVLEGAVEGSLDLMSIRLSPAPWRASKPLSLMPADPARWSLSQDPAVKSTLTASDDGPEGTPCVRYDLEMPGGRHMFAIPGFGIQAGSLDGYSGLRITYRTAMPPGIDGLLFMIGEQGAQWVAEPAPQGSTEWTTVIVPFPSFALGAWSKDDNGVLDLGRADTVMCGMHGTAEGDLVRGTVWISSIEALP
jgi:hypothetical protein